MIKKWLKESPEIAKTNFKIIEIKEEGKKDKELLSYLAKNLLFSYRPEDFLKNFFRGKSQEDIKNYIEENVFPSNSSQITKNVRQGDFGEILGTEIIKKFRNLNVPFCKIQWKMNNDKSVFCTDILSHNYGEVIKELNYYEVKTRINSDKKVCVKAHNSLLKDIPNQPIADYLQRLYYDKAETVKDFNKGRSEEYYELSNKYGDIVTNSQNYLKKFEIMVVMEESKFEEEIIDLLENLPPEMNPLNVTIIKISDLKDLFERVFETAKKEGLLLEHGER